MRLLSGGTAFSLRRARSSLPRTIRSCDGWAPQHRARRESAASRSRFRLFDHSSNPLKHRRAGLEELAAHLNASSAGGGSSS
ncbi:MAG: hypothetical protein R3F11_14200 [Verrucomicrobiales bacterium]